MFIHLYKYTQIFFVVDELSQLFDANIKEKSIIQV